MHRLLLITLFLLAKQFVNGQYYQNRVTLDSADYTIRFYYSDENPKPKKNKAYYWYKSGKIHFSEGGYSAHLLDDLYEESYPGNNIYMQGYFKNGIKTGEWKIWYPSGILKDVSRYDGSGMKRYSTNYDSTGRVIREGHYSAQGFYGKKYQYTDSTVKVYRYKKNILIPEKIKKEKKEQIKKEKKENPANAIPKSSPPPAKKQ